MKVVARFEDGSTIEIPVPEHGWLKPTQPQAIEYAKEKIKAALRLLGTRVIQGD